MRGAGLRQILIFLSLVVLIPGLADGSEMQNPMFSELASGFDAEMKISAYGQQVKPSDSRLNPDNRFLKLSQSKAQVELRPELGLDFRRLALDVSPRLKGGWQRWESSPDENETDTDLESNLIYWRARLRALESVYISYGRENLQWGPSYLYSPSNPFFKDNGKQNPHLEIDGMDFARLVWLESDSVTISLIHLAGPGLQEFASDSFSQTTALKIDFVGDSMTLGTIVSRNFEDHQQIGAWGTWIASEGLLIYGEGALVRGTFGRYPRHSENVFGLALARTNQRANQWFPSALGGAAYTFYFGPTFVIEYLYYGPGYVNDQAEDYDRLLNTAKKAFISQGPDTSLGAQTLGFAADKGLRFLRQNYLLLQVHQSEVGNVFDYALRWTQNLDDGSGQLTLNGDLFVSDHVNLFSVSLFNFGRNQTEFKEIMDYSQMLGIKFLF